MSHTVKEIWGWVRAIVIAIVVALLIRQFIFSNYIVRGESMMPTLQDGNRLVVDKIGYTIGHPRRFDIVVFRATESENYVKRIIGLPGDRVSYRDDQLYVNDKPVKEPYLDPYKEQLPDSGPLTEDFTLEGMTGETRVPEGRVWVMGDNRRNSVDSRVFGFVDEEQIIGKVDFRYWPVDAFGTLDLIFKR